VELLKIAMAESTVEIPHTGPGFGLDDSHSEGQKPDNAAPLREMAGPSSFRRPGARESLPGVPNPGETKKFRIRNLHRLLKEITDVGAGYTA